MKFPQSAIGLNWQQINQSTGQWENRNQTVVWLPMNEEKLTSLAVKVARLTKRQDVKDIQLCWVPSAPKWQIVQSVEEAQHLADAEWAMLFEEDATLPTGGVVAIVNASNAKLQIVGPWPNHDAADQAGYGETLLVTVAPPP